MGDASYFNQISPASECLFVLASDHRFHDRSTVYCYEISTCAPDSRRSIELLHHEPSSDKLRQFWRAENATCHSRLVVVEDISHPLIVSLGNLLGLDPLIFIQHLKGSGVNDESLDPLVGIQCIDTFPGTDIIPAHWYRPVNRLLEHGKKETRFSLPRDRWPTGDSGSEAPGLRGRRPERLHDIETNIFRGAWEIGKPSTPVTDDHISTVPAAWEERATIYRESRGGIEFGKLGIITRVFFLFTDRALYKQLSS